MKKIAIVDPSSRGLPYDYYYISQLSKYYKVDFYFSKTKYNYEYIDLLRKNENVGLYEYNISNVNKILGTINYWKMLNNLNKRYNYYSKIHFFWSIFFSLEQIYFSKWKDKLIFTFHNDKPHGYEKDVYLPYKKIYNLSYKTVFLSSFTKNRFFTNYKLNEKKSILLPHGLLPISSSLKELEEEQDYLEKTVVFWGNVKDYKGLDIILEMVNNKLFNEYCFEIIGKWDKNMLNIYKKMNNYKRIKIINKYISLKEMEYLFKRKVIFILPYKNATQSGVLYTLLNYKKVFISSNVGENYNFLEDNNLKEVIFDRKDIYSVFNALNYAINNYNLVKNKLNNIKKEYEWENIMKKEKLRKLYE